ncbi:O-methyltransferase [Nocardioides sp. Leaf374]|uniref:O-methyltransferase n=1 Tax=Nocardioides sp. Leaf374 TaxID=2876560 RepID=UPI001E4E855F|nr:class I SAM-dependent methyltransferase [Nocardioides sp. Leaf374]
MPEPVPGPRPVTPVGIVAALLERVEAGLVDVAGVPDDVRADLARARAVAGGLEPYLEAGTSPESPALTALTARTQAEDWSGRSGGVHLEQEMLSGHVEGALLQLLVRTGGARRVLEVGMFTGYSALAMAEALPEGGEVVACELDAAVAALAAECFAASPAGGRIRVEVGPALATLRRLADAGEVFDLVFVDADKTGYAAYVDLLLDTGLLAEDGLLALDNTLLQGEPWAGGPDGATSANGRAVADLNAALAADPRVQQVLVPLRDGLTLARRV